tara:strand:+ start:929 stop:1264 length:336 start_codon:yes stop_codon:yes gene_type:complete
MIWPPVKAWTCKTSIDQKIHFVAINYGGELNKKWVLMMSVIDSNLIVKVSLSELLDSSKWVSGWDEIKQIESSKFVHKANVKQSEFTNPSFDSGLTIPITDDTIRPWFEKV